MTRYGTPDKPYPRDWRNGEAAHAFRVADAWDERNRATRDDAWDERNRATRDAACLEVATDLVRASLPALLDWYPELNASGWGPQRELSPNLRARCPRYVFDQERERDELLRYGVDGIAFCICWLSAPEREV